MNIREMHVTFREMAQQTGMQTVRAILDEDIDIVLNSAIIDKVREVLTENTIVTPYPDKVIRQNAVIAPINSIRTLYCKAIIDEDEITTESPDNDANEVYPWRVRINSKIDDDKNVMFYTGFKVSYNHNSLYDCRIIESEDLGQTIRDFCNRPAPDAPIAVVYGNSDEITIDLYTGRTINTFTKVTKFKKPVLVQFLYIKEPAIVHFDIDDINNVDCDLPAYLHSEIVERAVSKYLISIGATSGSKQRQTNNNYS